MDVFTFTVAFVITSIVFAFLFHRRRGGEILLFKTNSSSIIETESSKQSKSYTAEDKTPKGRGQSECIQSQLTDSMVSATETAAGEDVSVSEWVQRITRRIFPRNETFSENYTGHTQMKDCTSKCIIMTSRGSQTDFSLICKDSDDSMHSKDSIENNSTPERNNGAHSSEGNVSEDILRSGTRPRDGMDGSSGDGAESTHVAANVSAPVPVHAPRASVEEIEKGPNTFHTDQHAEAIDTLECDSGSDTDDLHNASFESIAGSVTSDFGMLLDDLSSQHSSFSIDRNVGEDSGLSLTHEESDSLSDEASPHLQRNVAQSYQLVQLQHAGLDTFENTDEQNIPVHSEDEEISRLSPPSCGSSNHCNRVVVALEESSATGEIVTVEESSATGEIVTLEESSATGEIVTLEESSATGEIVTLEESNATGEIVTLEESSATGEIVTLEESSATGEIVTLEESSATGEIVTLEESSATGEIVTLEESSATSEIVTRDESSVNDENEATSEQDAAPVGINPSRERRAVYEAGHFVSSAFHVGHRQRSPFWTPGMGHPRTSPRPFHQAQALNPTSLRAISASHVYRNGSPAYRGNIMLSQCPTSLYSHPAPAPPPPAYTLNPPQYTVIPDELPPAYSLTDPLVSQTAMLMAQTSSAVSSDQQALPTRAENGADLDCTTRSEQDPENAGTESTPSVDGQTQHSSERHFSATEVAEEESLPPSSGTYQDSERQNLSPAGTDLPTSISDTADIAEDEDQGEVFSEQPGTSSDTDSHSPPRGYPETRRVSQQAEKFSSSSLDGDIEQSGFSPGCSGRRTAPSRKPSEADTAQSQPSQATTVPDSTVNRDGRRVSSTAVRADAGRESEQASARPERRRRDRSRRHRSPFVFPIPFLNGPVYGQTFTEHMNCVAGHFGIQDQGPLSSDDSTSTPDR